MSEVPRIEPENLSEMTRRELLEALLIELEAMREAMDRGWWGVIAWRLGLAFAGTLELLRREKR